MEWVRNHIILKTFEFFKILNMVSEEMKKVCQAC